jgi:RNA polymerase sigma-70 factor (ECF subfamily)
MWVLGAVLSTSESAAADRAAIERMARGDHDALGEIYDRHSRLVYSLALRIVRDQSDAEDVVQEVFSQAWRLAARYDAARGTVLGWLLTLSRSRAIDRVRSRKARPEPTSDELLLETLPATLVPADEQLAWAGQATRIRTALEGLSALQRQAIELAFFEGLTHAEIAERLELPLGTVKTRIRQGLLTLRERLAGVLR